MLRELLVSDSHASRIAKAIQRVRAEFHIPLAIADLAKAAGMSASSFHEHFKAVTGTTPLQYQKALRLQEARRLMLTAMMDAGDASRRVGYLSASQFSREYGRFFGNAPTRDIGTSAGARCTG